MWQEVQADQRAIAMKFLHTSDWHLGRRLTRLGPRSTSSYEWRFAAVRRMYQIAEDERAEFILVAGDVFQSETPSPETVRDALELLRDAPCPLVLIPGNHDPLAAGSVWLHDDFGRRLAHLPHIQLGLQPQPLALANGEVLLFPCPVTRKNCPHDQTAWIPPGKRGDVFRIGLAHGILQGYDGQEHFENFIHAERADLAGLDYLALGDLHSYTPADHPAARRRSYYSGAIECTAIDEQRPGHVLLVEMDAPGTEPQVTPRRVGRMRPVWLGEFVLSPGGGWAELREAVESIPEPQDVWLGLTVEGSLAPAELEAFDAWEGGLTDRFLGVTLERSRLWPEPSEADFAELGLDESERRVLRLLSEPGEAARACGWEEGTPAAQLAARADVQREARAYFYRLLRDAADDH